MGSQSFQDLQHPHLSRRLDMCEVRCTDIDLNCQSIWDSICVCAWRLWYNHLIEVSGSVISWTSGEFLHWKGGQTWKGLPMAQWGRHPWRCPRIVWMWHSVPRFSWQGGECSWWVVKGWTPWCWRSLGAWLVLWLWTRAEWWHRAYTACKHRGVLTHTPNLCHTNHRTLSCQWCVSGVWAHPSYLAAQFCAVVLTQTSPRFFCNEKGTASPSCIT